jgi:uncharacterized protein YkwD
MSSRSLALALSFSLAACGSGSGASSSHGAKNAKNAGDDPKVEQRTIVEKTPGGGTRTRVITTTTRTEEVPSPPVRPADPYPGDPLVRYNVELLNGYRQKAGAPPLAYDAKMSGFALDGSKRLSSDHKPHAHFAANGRGSPVFGPRIAENQGDPNGVPALDPDPTTSGKKAIALLLKIMIDEGPGGGHHDNMLNPKYRRVGIGLHYASGKLYLTNDFSD